MNTTIEESQATECIEPIERTVEELVTAACAGDREAFGTLVERFQQAVYATVYRRLGNHAEAQELCQDVFLQAFRKLPQLRDPACFGGWLRSIAARMAINRAVRTTPEWTGSDEPFLGCCAEQESPLATILRRERAAQVKQGLQRLGELDRTTLEAFYFDGQTLLQMSDAFGSPLGTIKRRLHVARQRLAKELAAMA